jgi:hypothetical protein
MNLTKDSMVEIDLGPASHPSTIRTLGKHRNLPNHGRQIV